MRLFHIKRDGRLVDGIYRNNSVYRASVCVCGVRIFSRMQEIIDSRLGGAKVIFLKAIPQILP